MASFFFLLSWCLCYLVYMQLFHTVPYCLIWYCHNFLALSRWLWLALERRGESKPQSSWNKTWYKHEIVVSVKVRLSDGGWGERLLVGNKWVPSSAAVMQENPQILQIITLRNLQSSPMKTQSMNVKSIKANRQLYTKELRKKFSTKICWTVEFLRQRDCSFQNLRWIQS